jgi:hypothetical protein
MLDRNLKNAIDGLGSLAHEVREGAFVGMISPGKGGAWRHKGIVFAAGFPALHREQSSERDTLPGK